MTTELEIWKRDAKLWADVSIWLAYALAALNECPYAEKVPDCDSCPVQEACGGGTNLKNAWLITGLTKLT